MPSLKAAVYQSALWAYRNAGVHFEPKRHTCVLGAGMDVLGFHGEILGIGETARQFSAALAAEGQPGSALEIDRALRLRDPQLLDLQAGARAVVSHLNPPQLLEFFFRCAPADLKRRPHIGYWVWELERTPRAWRRAERLVDAVWTPSEFSANAIRHGLSDETPVCVLPPPVFQSVPDADALPPGVLDTDRVTVLAQCDLRSSAARKNPMGAIRAFSALPEKIRNKARLLIKLVGGGQAPEQRRALVDQAQSDANIHLIETDLSDAAMLALIAGSDIAINLHRSEGFGLLPAQAAFHGVPVIATAWSAPVEYLSEDGAGLVEYELSAVEDPSRIYSGDQFWAEPDLDAASHWLERLIEDSGMRKTMGAAARVRARDALGPHAWWDRFRQFHAQIAQN